MKKITLSLLVVLGLLLSACSVVAGALPQDIGPSAQPTPQPPAPTAQPAVVPTEAAASCPPAEQLGPWAPNADGTGENFEVTAYDGYIVLSLYWPQGKLPNGSAITWGIDELVVLLSPGTSIEVWHGAGTGFEYAQTCWFGEVSNQLNAYLTNRPHYTANWHGLVTLDELLRLELVSNRLPLP